MTLTAAQDAITAEFPLADKDAVVDVTRTVNSGGAWKPLDAEPALYISADSAIWAWRVAMLEILRDGKATSIKFMDGPHLDKWHITVTDSKRTQRVAEDRYSVTAKVGIVRAVDVPAPQEGEAVAAVLPKPKPAKAARKRAA